MSAESEIKRSYRKHYLYGFLMMLLIPFALVATLRTCYENKVRQFNRLAVYTYNNIPYTGTVWEWMPYVDSENLIVTGLFVILVLAAVLGPIYFLNRGHSQRMLYREQLHQALKDRLRDDIRRRIDPARPA